MSEPRDCSEQREPDTVEALILDLLEWMGPSARPYAEVIEAWRTSCPRLPVWEDANDRGFIARHHAPGRGMLVSVSQAGVEYVREHRRPAAFADARAATPRARGPASAM